MSARELEAWMIPADAIARFWKRVVKADGDGCWLWQGSRNDSGYGVMRIDSDLFVYVHRLIAVITLGRIGHDQEIDHRCHDAFTCALGNTCPHRICVNPMHLAIVPRDDNQKFKIISVEERAAEESMVPW